MRVLFLLIVFLMSGKCFAQADTILLSNKYTTNGTFTTQWGKEVTSNYTLTEDDNGSFIYVNATANVTIPLFKVPFICTVVRVGAGKVTFIGASWRAGFTPLTSRLQSVTITALPNRTAIIL